MNGRAIAAGVVAALVAAAVAMYAAGWLLSRPVQMAIGAPPPSLDAESVSFASRSGSTIHGWLSRPAAPRGAVLLLPGIRGNRTSMARRAEFLRRAGFATLAIDFQATGESIGPAITFGWNERHDVLAAVEFLRARVPGRPVALIGVSLGGAATLLATPPLDVQAAVLEAVYPSIDRALANRLDMRVGRLGELAAPMLLLQLGPRLGVSASELRPIDHIANFKHPLLIVAGDADRHTTLADTDALFRAANEPKTLWLIPGAAHVDFLEFAGEAYRARILEFLNNALSNL